MTTGRARVRMDPAERRAQIIAVATRLIAEGGFNTFTMSQLAAEAEITRAGIEHHFASKEEVLIAVLRHRDDVDQHVIFGAARGPAAPDVDLWESFTALVHRNARQREIVRLYAILGAEALDPAHPAYDYFAERGRDARHMIAEAATGVVDDPELFAVEMLALMDGLQLQWLRDPALDLEQLWAGAVRRCRPVG